MITKTDIRWHECSPKKKKILFLYKKKPKNEKNYSIKGKYKRLFYECNKCNHVWAKHFFSINNLYKKSYLDLTYKNLKGLSKRFNSIKNLPIKKSDNKNRVIRICNYLNNKKINLLDIGCGTGVFLYSMKQKGHTVTGLDLDVRYKEFLKKKGLKVYVSKLNKLKVKKKYKLVTLIKVLEHVQNPLNFLKQSLKFIKNEGLVYIEVPDVYAKHKGKFTGEFCLDHLQIFSVQSLISIANSSGLYPLKVESIIEPSNKYTIYGFFRLLKKN